VEARALYYRILLAPYPLVSKEIILINAAGNRTKLIIKHLGTFVNIKSKIEKGKLSGN
jgi:hypothetical protein